MDAWSIIKEGSYKASSEWWLLQCIANTKRDALSNARRLAGGSINGSGLRAVKIEIQIKEDN